MERNREELHEERMKWTDRMGRRSSCPYLGDNGLEILILFGRSSLMRITPMEEEALIGIISFINVIDVVLNSCSAMRNGAALARYAATSEEVISMRRTNA